MNYQLMWNEDAKSGYIRNKIYKHGYVFDNLALKPRFSYQYNDIMYDNINNIFTITVNGETIEMNELQKKDALNACVGWVDTSHNAEENDVTLMKQNKRVAVTEQFDFLVSKLSPNTPLHEMASWGIQEEEARAWVADKKAPTPFLDTLLNSRSFAEDKNTLTDTIIRKADFYRQQYAVMLGDYHRALFLIESAKTAEDVKAIEFGQ